MESWQIENKRSIEEELIKLRALLITQPLNTRIKTYIEQYEDCLKKNYPESKLLVKNITSTPLEINNSMITKNKKKKAISSTIKKLVWNTNIGEEIGKSKCTCCSVTDITQLSFHCGHIIAEANGGETTVSNLKPICQNCNSSMGTKDMNIFMKSFI